MKTERKRRLKGSVLFTVVSVMSIMIIFMTCTLALATAANRRSRKAYSTSQSSYTARTTIDSILAAVGTNTEFSKGMRELSSKGVGSELDVLVDINNASMGSISDAKIAYTGQKNVYDPESASWVTRNTFKISAEVTLGGETTTIESTVMQDPPIGDGGGGGGAAFLTYGGASLSQRTGGWGGTYLGVGKWADKSWQELKYDYNYWNDSDNKLTIIEDGAYLTGETYTFSNPNLMETPFVVNGNVEVGAQQFDFHYDWAGTGINNPGINIWGDLKLKNGVMNIKMSDKYKEYIYTDDKSGTIPTHGKGFDFLSMPYIYVDGTLSTETGTLSINCQDLPLNIFCGNFMMTQSGGLNIRADLYCMDMGVDSKVVAGDASNLYGWASSVIGKGISYSSVGGNLYSKGNLNIEANKDIVFDNDVKINGDLIITGNNGTVAVKGDLVVGGKIDINGNNLKLDVDGDVYCDAAYGDAFTGVTKTLNDAEYEVKQRTALEEKKKDYYLIYNYKAYGTQHKDYGWVKKSSSFDFTSATPNTDPANIWDYDFKDAPIANTAGLDIVNDMYGFGKLQTDMVDYYVSKTTNAEVPEEQAFTYSGTPTLNGKAAKTIQEYKDAHDNTIYPAQAERETLMGVNWPIKGIEHRVVAAANVDPAIVPEMDTVLYDGTSIPISNTITINSSGTLTGTFNSVVKVVSPGHDIYVKLKNVDFQSPENIIDEVSIPSNTARIEVDESAGGRVYFVLEDSVSSNYYYKDEKSTTKLLKTVWDWMDQFNLEAIDQKPGNITNIITPPGSADEVTSYTITTDTVLRGAWSSAEYKKKDIMVVAPSTGSQPLWIVLDGTDNPQGKFSLGSDCRIIVDESAGGEVYFYVRGDVTIDNAQIITKKLADTFDSNGKINILSNLNGTAYLRSDTNPLMGRNGYEILEPLKVRMFSEDGASLNLQNNALVSAYIQAIHMKFSLSNVSETLKEKIANAVIYNGQPLSETSLQYYGVIGMLNVESCSTSNDWCMLFVNDQNIDGSTPGPVVDAEGKHIYDAIEYMAYAS